MILLIDNGNSRLKWALASDSHQVERSGTVAGPDVPETALTDRVDRIVIASVRGGEYYDRLMSWAEAVRPGQVTSLQTPAERHGLVNAYADPGRLGVDRWLAMLGAWRRRAGAFLLVDAGTAVTLDLVDAHGQHQGGAILPGRELMTAALVGRTSGIRPRPEDGESGFPARNTGAAVTAGATLGLGGAVREAMTVARDAGTVGPVMVTGGDAEAVIAAARLESGEFERIGTLVFEGMLEML